MKPAPFDYRRPTSLPEALSLLGEHGGEAKLLAGGQSLIPVMNFRLAQPAVLVDVNRLAGLDFVRPTDDGGLAIGALTRHRTLERDSEVAARAPLVAEAMPFVAHPQIRNRGTLGGSLAHADPAAELPALAVALGARLRLQKAGGGDRWADAGSFYRGLFDTELAEDEMITEIAVPPTPVGAGFAFAEVARRHGDYAQVGVAAMIALDPGGRCREARLALFAVGPTPVVARRAEASLVGEAWSDGLAVDAGATAASEDVDPTGDVHASAAFKRHLTSVLVKRTVTTAWRRAAG